MSNENIAHENTAFTLGPWEIHHYAVSSGHDSYAFLVAPHWFDFAQIVVRVNGEDSKEGKANLHLIASAPELYEALADFIRVARNDIVPGWLFDNARKALAKARGEAILP